MRILLAGLLLLAAAFSGRAEEPGTSASTADVGATKARLARLAAKAGQVNTAYLAVSSKPLTFFIIDPKDDRPPTELLAVYRQLYFVASATSRFTEITCVDKATRALCGSTFKPAWLVYPKDANPTAESLATWTGETEVALEPLWQGMCKLAAEKTGNPNICGAPV